MCEILRQNSLGPTSKLTRANSWKRGRTGPEISNTGLEVPQTSNYCLKISIEIIPENKWRFCGVFPLNLLWVQLCNYVPALRILSDWRHQPSALFYTSFPEKTEINPESANIYSRLEQILEFLTFEDILWFKRNAYDAKDFQKPDRICKFLS